MDGNASPAILEGLNPQQRDAVCHTEGPLLVIAGPGSGKTRVITSRIAHLIAKKVPPHNICAITFTKKAAGEMADRVAGLVGMRLPWVSTFHSMCAKILRFEAAHAGFESTYSIYDVEDQHKIIKAALKQLNLDPQFYRPADISNYISAQKRKLCLPRDAGNDSIIGGRMVQVYEAYEQALKESNALDFDDLLLKTVLLFRDHPDVLERYQDRFTYILVDEYQDTNHLQYLLVEQLAHRHRNICVTGDPDQSIYGWRGASIANILNFETTFKNCAVVRLEQNYRSAGNILKGASAVIRNNTERKEKELWTEADDGAPLELVLVEDEHAEAEHIARTILDRSLEGTSLADIAVFYRTTPQSRAIEQSLIHNKIPYMIIGGVLFFQRREVKDMLAYLQLIINPKDTISFGRVVNIPPRGVGSS